MTFDLNLQEGKFLIKLARTTVKEFLCNGKRILPPKETDIKFFEQCGFPHAASGGHRRAGTQGCPGTGRRTTANRACHGFRL